MVFEDESHLVDYLRIIWKWKFAIVAGTIGFMAITGIVGLLMAKTYTIETVLQLGGLGVPQLAQNLHSDFLGSISSRIEVGAFDDDVLAGMPEAIGGSLPASLDFRVNKSYGPGILVVSYETGDVDFGVQALRELTQVLQREIQNGIEYFRRDYEKKIANIRMGIALNKARQNSAERRLKMIEKELETLRSEVTIVRENTAALMNERGKLISNRESQASFLTEFVYNNMIQQYLAMGHSCRKQLQETLSKQEDEKLSIESLNNSVARQEQELKDLEAEMETIGNIFILTDPKTSVTLVKPKLVLSVVIASVLGLFVMLLVAFSADYIARYRLAFSGDSNAQRRGKRHCLEGESREG